MKYFNTCQFYLEARFNSAAISLCNIKMSGPAETRQFMLTGDAAAAMMRGPKGSRSKRKNGGYTDVMKSGVATAGVLPLGVKSTVAGYTSPSLPSQGAAPLQGAPPITFGGAKPRVELKKPAAKVHLIPKKTGISTVKKQKTRKARKITIGLSALHKRVTRAKKIRDDVKEMPLDDLRKELIKRSLIKENSKAPESILRQIAADAQIMGGNGL